MIFAKKKTAEKNSGGDFMPVPQVISFTICVASFAACLLLAQGCALVPQARYKPPVNAGAAGTVAAENLQTISGIPGLPQNACFVGYITDTAAAATPAGTAAGLSDETAPDTLSGVADLNETAAGGRFFVVTGFYWFSNWREGWTEVLFSSAGRFEILPEVQTGKTVSGRFRTVETPELIAPEKASVRFRDTLVEGTKGVEVFANRWDRICAVNGFLNEKMYADEEQFLFPEVFGYCTPDETNGIASGEIEKAEGISWNTRYTEVHFPERFHQIRNTGTLYRDWEETAALAAVQRSWNTRFAAGSIIEGDCNGR